MVSKEVEGGRCMSECDGKLCLSEKEKGKFNKDYMKQIIKEGNDRDHYVNGPKKGVIFKCYSSE